jgi:membrane associated rhomboid family serine protease
MDAEINMFLPIGDTPNPLNFKPVVNWVLIAMNVGVFILVTMPMMSVGVDPGDPLLEHYVRSMLPRSFWGSPQQLVGQLSAYDLFVFDHGYRPAQPELADLVTSMFLHGSFGHLVGNMLFLWIYGDNVEHHLGRVRYALTYLGTGVAATLTFHAFAAGSPVPMVGASGAISGILGLYFVLFPHNRVKVFVMLFPFIMRVLLIPARWVLGFYLVWDNLLPVLIGAQSSTAYGAHIGGFLAGAGLTYWWERRSGDWSPFVNSKVSGSGFGEFLEPLARLRQDLQAGNAKNALELFGGLSPSDIQDLGGQECVTLANWLNDAGYPIAAMTLLKRYIAQNSARVNQSQLAQVYLALGRMRMHEGRPTAAYQHLLEALQLNPDTQTRAEAEDLIARIQSPRRLTID